jgi:hypothetical protein
MTCAHCGASFDPKHSSGRFCKPACRAASWHKQRHERLSVLKTLLVRAIEEVDVLEQVGTRRKAKRP